MCDRSGIKPYEYVQYKDYIGTHTQNKLCFVCVITTEVFIEWGMRSYHY